MRKIIFIVSLFIFNNSFAQIITTIAGEVAHGFCCDGGPATAAELDFPGGVRADASGNAYIADGFGNRVRKVSASGIIITLAGNGVYGYSGDGGQATNAELEPFGVVPDNAGNIFIADKANCRIRKVDASGIISTFAGTGVNGYSGDGGQATAAKLSNPEDAVFDASGNMFVVDAGNNCIRMINTLGVITTVAGNGTTGYTGDGGPATAAEMNLPRAITLDAAGNMYIADYTNNVVRKVNTSGIISTVAGNGLSSYSGDGGQATAAEIGEPCGVAVDPSGNIYISDYINNRLRFVNAAGIINTAAGNYFFGYSGDGGPATAAELYGPQGLYLDASGNLYIADYGNGRIREITPAPFILRIQLL